MPTTASSTRQLNRHRTTHSISASPGKGRTKTIRSDWARQGTLAPGLTAAALSATTRPLAIMTILMLRLWRGFEAPSTRFPRITTAVRPDQSLEHWRKWRWIFYPWSYGVRKNALPEN